MLSMTMYNKFILFEIVYLTDTGKTTSPLPNVNLYEFQKPKNCQAFEL